MGGVNSILFFICSFGLLISFQSCGPAGSSDSIYSSISSSPTNDEEDPEFSISGRDSGGNALFNVSEDGNLSPNNENYIGNDANGNSLFYASRGECPSGYQMQEADSRGRAICEKISIGESSRNANRYNNPSSRRGQSLVGRANGAAENVLRQMDPELARQSAEARARARAAEQARIAAANAARAAQQAIRSSYSRFR